MIKTFILLGSLVLLPSLGAVASTKEQKSFPLPVVDLSEDTARHRIVAQGTDSIYHGHPSTVLLPDGKTMYAVWTYGHAGFCGPLKRSDDGGKAWSEFLDVPASWKTVKNCPTIWNLKDPSGRSRLLVFAAWGPDETNMHVSVSEDEGRTWSEMRDLQLEKSKMPLCTIEPIRGGQALLGLSNARRVGDPNKKSNVVVQTISTDGGLSWQPWKVVLDLPGKAPCEPWMLRSPDGREILCLLRENSTRVSLRMSSRDEGGTWSAPEALPIGLHGDRHVAKYLPDGRVIVCFRDKAKNSPTFNNFVAWIGRYEDLLSDQDKGYRVKLLTSHRGFDCGYAGVEILPDGTIVATTYVKYRPGPEKNSIVSTRFTLAETDRLAGAQGWKG